ncbi:extensin-like [Cucurbita maxima]|uniref:Extensin-like n=1 Tax=Cucurbita maxima TaxID=3661 RepID=A0A6J1HQV2_CUCMA|nr:extensin-like [Cucurbita maxima]
MDSSKNYRDFSPTFVWHEDHNSRVLTVPLKDFRSSQLKVQVTSTGKLRAFGERMIEGNKWLRFYKELDVPTDTDTDKISAKFEDGVLYVKHPKKLSAAASTNLPEKPTSMPKPKPESRPPPAAGKPKTDPQPPAEPPKPAAWKPKADPRPPAEPPKPAAGKPKADPRPPAEPPKPAAGKPKADPRPPAEPPKPAAGKPKADPRPPAEPPKPAAGKPKADPQPPAEPPKPAAEKSTVHLPTVPQNAPNSRNEKRQSQSSSKEAPTSPGTTDLKKELEDQQNLLVGPQTVPQRQNEEPQEQAHGKQTPSPQKEKTEEEKAKAHTNLKEAMEKTRDEERGKEVIGSKMGEGKGNGEKGSHGREEKEGEVAEERRRRSEGTVEESFLWRRREGYKQVIDGVVKELRKTMVTLVLGIAVLVILYLKVTNKGHVDEEL